MGINQQYFLCKKTSSNESMINFDSILREKNPCCISFQPKLYNVAQDGASYKACISFTLKDKNIDKTNVAQESGYKKPY